MQDARCRVQDAGCSGAAVFLPVALHISLYPEP